MPLYFLQQNTIASWIFCLFFLSNTTTFSRKPSADPVFICLVISCRSWTNLHSRTSLG